MLRRDRSGPFELVHGADSKLALLGREKDALAVGRHLPGLLKLIGQRARPPSQARTMPLFIATYFSPRATLAFMPSRPACTRWTDR
jgi:hypothetical protein